MYSNCPDYPTTDGNTLGKHLGEGHLSSLLYLYMNINAKFILTVACISTFI